VSERLQLRVKRQTRWQQIPIERRRASIEISTSNPRCAGDYLEAQLDWARDRFTDFQVVVGDTLQIHNYLVLGHPVLGRLHDEAKTHQICLDEGDQWLRENEPIMRRALAGRPWRIERWDTMLAKPGSRRALVELEHLYETDDEIHRLVREDVTGYLHRRHHDVILTEEQLRRLDRHVLDELAVYQFQADNGNYVSLYPGTNQLLLRPKHLESSRLPEVLKKRHYVTLHIKPVGVLAGVGA